MEEDVLERFNARIDRLVGGCWRWTGRKQGGHPRYGDSAAATLAYEHFVGPVPEGMRLRHTCGAIDCVNPVHLTPSTATDLPTTTAAINAAKTHCPHGHPYDDANTYRPPNGQRVCRICQRESRRPQAARKATR